MSAFKDLTKTPGEGKRIYLAPVLQKLLSKIKWKLSKDRKLKKQSATGSDRSAPTWFPKELPAPHTPPHGPDGAVGRSGYLYRNPETTASPPVPGWFFRCVPRPGGKDTS